MARTADKYRIDSRILKLLLWLPGLLILFQLTLTFPTFAAYRVYFWGENLIIEQLQFLFFFFASVQAVVLAWHMIKQREAWIVRVFYLLAAAAFFFIAMEEIAWGQQYLHFNSPEAIKAFNVQNEVTLHNVELLQDRTDILNLAFGLAGLIGIVLGTQPVFKKIGVPRYLLLWFGLIAVLSGVGVFNDFVSVNSQFDYSVHKQTETAELLIAIAGFLFVFFNNRAYNLEVLRPVNIIAVDPDGPDMRLELSDGRVMRIPAEHIPGGALPEQAEWRIAPDGQAVARETPAASFKLTALLKPPSDSQRVDEQLQSLWSRWNFWIVAAAGLMVAIWLLQIPSDPKNAWLAGLSPTRFLMVSAALMLSAGLIVIWFHFTRQPVRYQTLCTRLNQKLMNPRRLFVTTLLSAVLLLASLLFLIFTYFNEDPFQRSILDRLAPWVAFIGLLSLSILAQLLWRAPGLRRPGLHHTQALALDQKRLQVRTTTGVQLEIPLNQIPRLQAAGVAQRASYQMVDHGLRVSWPEIGIDLCTQQFFAGMSVRDKTAL